MTCGEVSVVESEWYAILYHSLTGWHRPLAYGPYGRFSSLSYLAVPSPPML